MIGKKRFTYSTLIGALLLGSVLSLSTVPTQSTNAATTAEYAFPVIGNATFYNDFEAPRSNGVHHAIDIIADKGQKIVSRTDGLVTFVGYPQPSWGYAVYVRADNGYSYRYLHINNDRPGTDDGKGGGYHAYGPDIQQGKRVVKGQLLGYVGDSGNAEETVSHLHFEVYDGDEAINPYAGLKQNSYHLSKPVVNYPKAVNEILPSSSFRGGATIAYGDLDNDGTDEIITGAGPGGKYVKAFNNLGGEVLRFSPNGSDFLGGMDVATGDVDGDGNDEIVTGAGSGGRYVKIFDETGAQLGGFMPNGPKFTGGIDVATGDLDNDGTDEIITGAGPGGKLVKMFSMDGASLGKFAPYGSSEMGITVTAGDVTGDERDEVITAARMGGDSRVSVFDNAGTQLDTFYAYSTTFKGGVRVAASDIRDPSLKDEIMTVAQSGGSSRVKLFSGEGVYIGYSSYFGEEWWVGNYDIAANDSDVAGSLGVNRRTSVRPVFGLQD